MLKDHLGNEIDVGMEILVHRQDGFAKGKVTKIDGETVHYESSNEINADYSVVSRQAQANCVVVTNDNKNWRVDIIESERGWGQKVDDVYFFETRELAEKFVKEHNQREYDKNKDVAGVPEIYWRAETPVKVK